MFVFLVILVDHVKPHIILCSLPVHDFKSKVADHCLETRDDNWWCLDQRPEQNMPLYVRSNRADHVCLEKCTGLPVDQPFWWDEMFSSKLEHLMGESQSQYKQYHYLQGICTHLCPQLRASVPAWSVGSCRGLTRATTLPSITFDARGRIHHVVGRLGYYVYVCVGSQQLGGGAEEWWSLQMWIWKRQKVSAYTCLFFHLSWRKEEALDLVLSKTVSFCFKRWKPVSLWGGARKWKKEEKGGSLEVRKLNEETGWSLAGCRDPWTGVRMIKRLSLNTTQPTFNMKDTGSHVPKGSLTLFIDFCLYP